MFWKFGRRSSPTGSSTTNTVPAPFRRLGLRMPLLERIALPRVVERRHVEVERQLIHAAHLEQPLRVHVDVADAAARRQVVVLAAVADCAVGRILGERDRSGRAARLVGCARERAEVHGRAVVGEAGVHHPVVRHPLAAGQLEAVEGAVVARDVRQVDDRRLLERRLVVGHRRAARAADAVRRRQGRWRRRREASSRPSRLMSMPTRSFHWKLPYLRQM